MIEILPGVCPSEKGRGAAASGASHVDMLPRTRTHGAPRSLWLAGASLFLCLSSCSRLARDFPAPADEPPPPPPLPSEHATVGLVSAVAGVDALRADWRVHSGEELDLELALFVSTSQSGLFSSTPIALDPASRQLEVTGLTTDDDYYVGLGARPDATQSYRPSGPVLWVRTGAVLYVDPAAAPGGDGLSPATAFDDLTLAVLQAFVANGGNVWVRQGAFDNVTLPLFTAVHVYGGFTGRFELAERDALAHPTLLRGVSGQPVVATQNGTGGIAILDGFELDGLSAATDGVSQSNEDCQLRSLVVHDCQRGIRLRTLETGPLATVTLTNVSAQSNLLEGVSVLGAFELAIEGCLFDSNGNEGLDLNHLIALEFGHASLSVRGTRLDRNGTEGLDCHLGVPPAAGTGGGSFDVVIEDCDAQSNALDGVRIDIDYDFFPEWESRTIVRGLRVHGNGAAGLHLDLDSRGSAFVHRLASSANRGDGLSLTSETFPGMCTLSSSALYANAGYGAQASLGHYALSASHCVFAGNLQGGLSSSVVGSVAHSCVFLLQGAATSGVREIEDVRVDASAPPTFVHAPGEYRRIVAAGAGELSLDAVPASRAGSAAETADDGVERALVPGIGTGVSLDPAPPALAVPGVLALFASGTGVDEDWRLESGSLALGAGLAAPGAPGVDAGIFGAPNGGVPGREDSAPRELFHVASTTPAWSDGLASNETLEVSFVGGTPDPASVASSVFAFGATGGERAIVPSALAGVLRIPPPAGGWSSGDVVVVFGNLRSLEGPVLGAPVALRTVP